MGKHGIATNSTADDGNAGEQSTRPDRGGRNRRKIDGGRGGVASGRARQGFCCRIGGRDQGLATPNVTAARQMAAQKT